MKDWWWLFDYDEMLSCSVRPWLKPLCDVAYVGVGCWIFTISRECELVNTQHPTLRDGIGTSIWVYSTLIGPGQTYIVRGRGWVWEVCGWRCGRAIQIARWSLSDVDDVWTTNSRCAHADWLRVPARPSAPILSRCFHLLTHSATYQSPEKLLPVVWHSLMADRREC